MPDGVSTGVQARLTIAGVALIAAFVPLPAQLVERAYSTSLYPVWQAFATSTSNVVPIALFDVMVIGVFAAWVTLMVLDVVRHRSRGWPPTILRIVTRTAVWAAALYVLFLACWGLNYRRVPLTDMLGFDHTRVSLEALRALTDTTIDRMNALYDPAHRAGFPEARAIDARLASAFAVALRDLGAGGVVVPARPKWTLLNPYFRRATVDGMTDPFFLETLVVSDLLDVERPIITAHEWAHLAGYADEGEASFVGWFMCMHGDTPQQYSGWLFLYSEADSTLPARDRRDLQARVGAGPRADLRAIADRALRNRSPRVANVGWRVYDQYLKANRVESGVASYTEVVRIVLGTRFNPSASR